MHNKVFISYAKEDQIIAENIYNFLISNNFDPWFDKKRLLPGQDWNNEIRFALRKSDFIVMLLSQTSVSKRGYVQRELKLALEYCEEKLDSDIYIIPCRIDDCEVPEKLLRHQWVNLKSNDAFKLILDSLNHQRNKYLVSEQKQIADKESFGYIEIPIKKEISDNPKIEVDIVYPQFSDIQNEDLRILNVFVENRALTAYNEFRSPFDQQVFFDKRNLIDETFNHIYELNLSYKFQLISKNIISYTEFQYTFTGGAHGLYGSFGYNYRLNPLREITIEMLFDFDEQVLPILVELCYNKLLHKAKVEFEIEEAHGFFYTENPFELSWDTFKNFYLNKNGLVIIFGIYQITAYAYGEHEVEITFDEILNRNNSFMTISKVKTMLS